MLEAPGPCIGDRICLAEASTNVPLNSLSCPFESFKFIFDNLESLDILESR